MATNIDQDLCRFLVSLGHNVLIIQLLLFMYSLATLW